MHASSMIAKAIADGKKEIALYPGLDTEIKVARRVSEIFAKPLNRLPRPLVNEIFAFAWPRTLESNPDILGDFCDLFLRDYDEVTDPLELQDWEFVSDLVNEYGTVLEIDLIEYIMMRVLEHKALG